MLTRELLIPCSIMYLVWRVLDWGLNPGPPALDASTLPLGYREGGPWLGIEPRTSRTRSQYSTTRLSRRRSLTGDWTQDLPALEASTLPLDYRGGGPWLGIEPGTSRTRSQYSTTRLSRRRSLTGDWTRDQHSTTRISRTQLEQYEHERFYSKNVKL